MKNQDKLAGAAPTRYEEHQGQQAPSEIRDTINGISIERWHERNIYHRQAMESRRSIQMKVFTGCVVLLLGIAKWGIDVLTGTGATEHIRFALTVGALTVPVFLFLFMLQIESANKRNREWYHFYQRRLDSHFVKIKPNDGESLDKEHWLKALLRSWAATWPILATLCLALLVAYTFNNVEIKESQTASQSPISVVEDSTQQVTNNSLNPQIRGSNEK